jgi:hypothetical protein
LILQAPVVEGLPVAADRVPGRYSAWLLRPLLDLGPFEQGPLYAQGVEHAWQAWAMPSLPRFALQRTLPPGFRELMLRAAGRPGDDATDPHATPPGRRTVRWQALCDALAGADGLDDEGRCRLAMLLHALCLHERLAALAPPPGGHALRRASRAGVELAYWGASARYMLRMPARFADYGDADLDEFDAIATHAPQAATAVFNATCKMFTHAAKAGANADRLAPTADRMAAALDRAATQLEAFAAGLLASRFHRARAFLPMRRDDAAAVRQEMDTAERFARALQPATPAQRLLATENLHPLMESRSKEAQWAGDHDAALAHAREVVALDVHDPKSHVELGQLLVGRQQWAEAADAFVTSAMLGPPTGAIARHLAGTCLQRAGQPALAAYFFQSALAMDAMAVSPRAALAVLPGQSVLASLQDWSGRRFQEGAC